jgi:Ca-activated chloride channel family protein
MPPEFHFIRPLWLLALLPLILLLWRLLRSEPGGDVWRGLVDAHLLPQLLSDDDGGRTRRLPLTLLGLGWLLGVLALAGPTWERLPKPVYQAQQYRVLALDLSPTMNTLDLSPSRLAHARFELLDLLQRSREGLTALLAYGAEPYLVAPLTSDTETIAAQVTSLSTELLPVQGRKRTDLVLAQAGELLHQAGAPEGEVILITDGLDNQASAYEAVSALRKQGYRVSVLGVGTLKGALAPLPSGGFLKGDDGSVVRHKLQPEVLRELASAGAGHYVTAEPGDQDSEVLIPSDRNRLAGQAEPQDTRSDQWREAGPWLTLVLLPLAALAFRRGWLASLVLVALVMPPPPAQAFDWLDLWLSPDQQGAREFAAGRRAEAAQRFERPDWRAAAAYESGEYELALRSLEGLNGPRAAYNKGNTLARLGQLQEALDAYDQALAAAPDDEEARHNRQLVKRLLEQQQQEEQEGEGEQEQSEQSDQQQQSQSEQDGEQEQQPSGSENQEQSDQQDAKQAGKQGQESDQEQDRQEGRDQSQASDQSKTDREERNDKQDADKVAKNELADTRDKKRTGEPDRSDLLDGDSEQMALASGDSESDLDPEDYQAMEQMLRRVQDDPAGLLRQRFLLQHLRRSGQMP